MSDVPPPAEQPQPPGGLVVPPAGAEAAAQRDRVEHAWRDLILAALLLYLATHGGGEQRSMSRRVGAAAATLSGVLLAGLRTMNGRLDPHGRSRAIDPPAYTLAGNLAEQAHQVAETEGPPLATLTDATGKPIPADELTEKAKTVSETWARTEATRAWSQMAVDLAEHYTATEHVPVSKLWLSRGDSRVRPLHRHLHAEVRPMERPFWRWPSTGKQLRFPGDPDAPLDQIINCRCVLFLVPTAERGRVPSAFGIPAEHFAASG